jgi:DNA-binding LacI/PurR family transcriptional regulator
MHKGLDGYIVAPTSNPADDHAVLRRLLNQDVPTVLIDKRVGDQVTDLVAVNHGLGAQIVVEHLAELGHRRVGVPVYDAVGFTWPKERLALLRLIAKRRHPGLTLTEATHTETFWDFEQYSALTDFTKTAGPELTAESAGLAVRKTMTLRDRLLRQTPSLATLLRDADVTALFALNDRFARGYFFWCKAVGVEIPGDLSMVSFDNIPDSVALPISTVDFGFSRLGYLAAHAFIGDIPVESRMGGRNIAGECTLIDRGSLARRRRGRLRQLG